MSTHIKALLTVLAFVGWTVLVSLWPAMLLVTALLVGLVVLYGCAWGFWSSFE